MSIDPGVTDDTRQRWLGLRSYEESDSDLFFGRGDDGDCRQQCCNVFHLDLLLGGFLNFVPKSWQDSQKCSNAD